MANFRFLADFRFLTLYEKSPLFFWQYVVSISISDLKLIHRSLRYLMICFNMFTSRSRDIHISRLSTVNALNFVFVP